MASATDIITYIGVPLAVIGVLPILYNTVQCLRIRNLLLRSLPVSARGFFHIQPNPVGGTVACTFRKPRFAFDAFLDTVKRCHAPVHAQPLPHVESHLLGASWMRLIYVLGLETKGKGRLHREVVDSSLNIDTVTIDCAWRSMISLVLGLGVSPLDPGLRRLADSDAAGKENLRLTALCSEKGQRLVEARWREGVCYFGLTEECSFWSIRRSLSYYLHLLVVNDGRQEILHFVPTTKETGQIPNAQICDCEHNLSKPVDPSIFQNIHFALTWTLYFEELAHNVPSEIIHIPQHLLLSQFKIIEELRQIPTQSLQSRISDLFPQSTDIVMNIMSALNSIWNSSEHQALLDRFKGATHAPKLRGSQQLASNQPIGTNSTQQQQMNNESPDLEKATETTNNTKYPDFDFYTHLPHSPTFHSLSSMHSPSAITIAARNHHEQNSPSPCPSPSPGPAAPNITVSDQTKPEGLLARLIIALSALRSSTTPRGWVTSIASGTMRYKVGPGTEEEVLRKLLEHEGGIVRIE